MAVDPKYAHLPWIANDGTDVYETEDLPEVDQDTFKPEDNSVETIKLNLDEAKKAFKDKQVNADDVDFSDRIRPYVNTGYVIERNQYVLYPENEQNDETVLDRFQRLQHEVRDLVNEIEQIKSSAHENSELLCKSTEILGIEKELESLTSHFTNYKLHLVLGAEESDHVAIDEDLCGFDTKEMFERIQKYAAKYKKDDSSQERLTWEKYYRSPLYKELNSAKIANIDQRIQRIEAAIGHGERCSNLSSLNSEMATKSLVEAVNILTSRCQPLKGGPNVDKIESRLVNLQSKLQNITEKRDLVTEADRQNKRAELFTLYQKWQQFQLALPDIVTRLDDLNKLHDQATKFSDKITSMEKTQYEMKKNLNQYRGVLLQVENTLVDCVQKIKSNINEVQGKVDRI